MPRILADALHDASLSEVEIRCEYKITTISYREFLQAYESAAETGVTAIK